jgi:hypothetical protein
MPAAAAAAASASCCLYCAHARWRSDWRASAAATASSPSSSDGTSSGTTGGSSLISILRESSRSSDGRPGAAAPVGSVKLPTLFSDLFFWEGGVGGSQYASSWLRGRQVMDE